MGVPPCQTWSDLLTDASLRILRRDRVHSETFEFWALWLVFRYLNSIEAICLACFKIECVSCRRSCLTSGNSCLQPRSQNDVDSSSSAYFLLLRARIPRREYPWWTGQVLIETLAFIVDRVAQQTHKECAYLF